MATGYQRSFGPEAPNDPVGAFLHWAIYGKQPGAGLIDVPGQFLHSIDPRSGAGLANLASMFAGGPKSEDILNSEMPGQFENYSTAKAALGGHLGHDQLNPALKPLFDVARNHPNPKVRSQAMQLLHDHLFGGEVHAKGSIPGKPGLDQVRARMARERMSRSSFDAEAAKQRAAQNMRRRVDERFGSAPMQPNKGYPEHDAGLLYGPGTNFHALLKNMIQRRYQARQDHNRRN